MLKRSHIKAITLDLDDTLWPVGPTIERAEQLLHAWLVQRAPGTAQLFGDLHKRLALRQQALQRLSHLQHDLSAIRHEMIRLGLEQSGEDTALADAGFSVFFDARMQVTLYPGAWEGLQRLAARYPLLAVSNGNADVNQVGLGHFFAGSVSARDAGVAKPDPRIFQAAAAHLKLPPEALLHVGDDVHMDVLGALDCGMQAVWINRHGTPWTQARAAHAQAVDLLDVCTLLGL